MLFNNLLLYIRKIFLKPLRINNRLRLISKIAGRIIRIQGVKGSGVRVKCLRIIRN